MSDTLLSILLVTSSSRGSSLVFRWPPTPPTSSRLRRAPLESFDLDNPWRTSHPNAHPANKTTAQPDPTGTIPDLSNSSSSFENTHEFRGEARMDDDLDYDNVFNYPTDFLAGLLCPQSSMCHQRFELVADDLVFIGHPVCAEKGGVWRFPVIPPMLDQSSKTGRGRHSRNKVVGSPSPDGRPPSSAAEEPSASGVSTSSWLHTFNLVLVLDLPDPSSSASGNLSKYFDAIYEHVAFPLTAVLFQEQVSGNFVETECDKLSSLKDHCASQNLPFSEFVSQATAGSSIAASMMTLYEGIRSSVIAQLTIHNTSLEVQLPPHLSCLLLHNNGENDEMDDWYEPRDGQDGGWHHDWDAGWRLPALEPWKSLLLLDSMNPLSQLRDHFINFEDRALVEGLIRFLENASVTVSLADMSSLLDWDLKTQIFPAVRWLVHHRRAKVVDIVHGSLKTIFTVPPKFPQSLGELSAAFSKEFTHPAVRPLPEILETISQPSASSGQHFFGSVVQSKDLIPLYHDVVTWMLQRDLLVTLHLHIRIIASHEVKLRARLTRERNKRRQSSSSVVYSEKRLALLSLSRQGFDRESQERSRLSELVFQEDDDDDDNETEGGDDGTGWDTTEDSLWPSMIHDPARATPLQRRWLTAMSEGKDQYIAKRFDKINQYFDGKHADDEILYRGEITRKQLREVLHHYEPYLQTFLHPS